DNSIKVSFNSIEEYAKDIRSCVDSKQLIAEKEFYSSVRFRGSESVSELVDEGVQYLEFRLFDLNPYAKYGIEEKDIRFIHLFILLMLWLDEENPSKSVEIGKDYSQL
ncbi:bifunctional glutamate--cysteine ligase/glutathione synthetase, partial [Streptococcus danieliae]|nr:bifunctional glutamate--cysteine ligase/glutathione synthetase [Streptococcus danieliae]